MLNISKNGSYMQIKNEQIITDPLENMVILPKLMEVGPTSNDLIQASYWELNEDEILKEENFNKKSIYLHKIIMILMI